MRRLLKKILRAIACLICFCFFVSPVRANDSYGGSLNTDISVPFRLMDFDIYGNYNIPQQNSAYFYSDDFCAGSTWDTTRVYSIETQESYAGGNLYSITIYLYNTDRTLRIVPAPSGSDQRRIGLGNSINQARTNWVGNTSSAVAVTYTNYSYDFFDVKLVNGTVIGGVYSVTYFFVPNQDNIAVAVPFGASSYKCGTYYFAGYRLQNLGLANNLSASDIQSVINSSGLATASSQSELKSSLNEVKQNITKLNEEQSKTNDILNDSSVSGSTGTASSFFDNFNSNSHGLSGIITAPLVFIRNLLNHSCTPLNFNLPFVNKNVNLPCMTAIYQNYFGGFFTLYQVITTGIIAYWVVIKIFGTIKGLQDPQNDRIEVFKL